MATQSIDDDGTIWFFSKADSDKDQDLKKNPVISLMYINKGKDSYLWQTGVGYQNFIFRTYG